LVVRRDGGGLRAGLTLSRHASFSRGGLIRSLFKSCAVVSAILLSLSAPGAFAGKSSKFVGDYPGDAKIVVGSASYTACADAVFKVVSSGKAGN